MPPSITTPDRAETELLGTLSFRDGMPSAETAEKALDFVAVSRGVEAFLSGLSATSVQGMMDGYKSIGVNPGDLVITRFMDARMLFLTPNTSTVYGSAELNVADGLLMYEVPAGPTGGLINDLWQRVVADTGMVGPERGQGGKFLIVLEGTEVPENHGADFGVTSKTNTVLIGTCILTPDPEEAERILNAHKIYEHLLLAGDPDNERPEARGNIPGDSFACPDGLALDARGVLWIQTDVSSDEKGRGEFQGLGNNQMLACDPATGEVRRFLTGPVSCEITGLALTPDGRTMFINIQHPGEPLTPRDDNLEVPNLHSDPADPRKYSNWPDFRPDGRPRSATVAIRRTDGGPIGT